MGGISSERDISLSTGKQILEALDSDKYDAYGVDAALLTGSSRGLLKGADVEISSINEVRSVFGARTLASVRSIIGSKSHPRADVVFIALHGKYGEDGTIQGALELLGIPYTGSGVLASALAMDKSMAKKVLAADGIPVPKSVDFTVIKGDWDRPKITAEVTQIGYPVMVKPSRQGSTLGMSKISKPADLDAAIELAADYDSQILVEQFISGPELTVSVLGNGEPFALPVIEILPKSEFYDYESKYAPGGSEHIIPARLSDTDTEYAQDLAVKSYKSLGCSGAARVDLIAGQEGMCVLEVNTIPGMTPTSLLPEAAKAVGISFDRLLDMLIEFACEKGE
jgi:D-alanine-D-alanine ligase